MRTYEENRLIAINMAGIIWLRTLLNDVETDTDFTDLINKMFKDFLRVFYLSLATSETLDIAEERLGGVFQYIKVVGVEESVLEGMQKTLNQLQEWLTIPELDE